MTTQLVNDAKRLDYFRALRMVSVDFGALGRLIVKQTISPGACCFFDRIGKISLFLSIK